MERAIKRTFTILAIFILLCGITLNIGQISAFAADEDIPKEGVTYTLTYPDGTIVTEKDGKPLAYDDVTEALKEENWRLLGSGYTSDKDGKAVLPSSWTEGTIKIIETKVPAGYTQGEESEKKAELKDGEITFVNPKIKDNNNTYSITYKLNGGEYNGKTEDIVEEYPEGTVIDIHEAPEREGYEFDYWKGSKYYPGDKYTVVENHTLVAQWKKTDDTQITDTTSDENKDKSKKTSIKKIKNAAATGDPVDLSVYFGFFISSLLAIAFALSYRFVFAANRSFSTDNRKTKGLIVAVLISLTASVLMASTVYAATGFTINKVDDSGDPVEGAVFDVYGKPAVTFEEKQQETIDITLTKTWKDESNSDNLRPSADEFKTLVELAYVTEGASEATKITDQLPTVTDNGDNTYTVKWEGIAKYADNGSKKQFKITEKTIEGYKAGEVAGSAESGFTITNTHTPVNINVGLEYQVYSGGKWSDVVKTTPQKVTVSGGSMTESKTLSFTPESGTQEVELPGAGTYTIKMQDISKNDLQSEETLSALKDSSGVNPMPIIIDTVSATVTVDESGNCTISGSPTYETYAFGADQEGTFIYNDIEALKEAYSGTGADVRLNTLNPHSKDAGASASGSTVTLTTVMSQGWDDKTDPAVQ